MIHTFYSNGKLLLTGEYLVIDGALALALPTKYGQKLIVDELIEPKLVWESYDYNDSLWLQVEFDLPRLRIISETFNSNKDGGNDSYALSLQNMLLEVKKTNPTFLDSKQGFHIKTKLTFHRDWGLGSSSTLINNIAQWAKVDAFNLQFNTFGGSGYDIACAQHNTPITYQLQNSKPTVKEIQFNPSFKDKLYFIYLNKKQNSRQGIASYKNYKGTITNAIAEISDITKKIMICKELSDFENLLNHHETIIAEIIRQEPIQQQLFSDYFGQTKSLGAWGGDFILATGNNDTPNYFKQKGFKTVIPYSEMILC